MEMEVEMEVGWDGNIGIFIMGFVRAERWLI